MATWSVETGNVIRLTLTGSESGVLARTHTFTAADGIQPSQQHTVYLDIDPSVVALNAFLEVVGGDQVVADVTGGETVVARGDSDAGSNLTVHFGVLNAENSPSAAGSFDLGSYLNGAAAAVDGFTPTGAVAFHVAHPIDVYPFSISLTGISRLDADFTGLTPGATYTFRLWLSSAGTFFWIPFAMRISRPEGGAASAGRNGDTPDIHLSASLSAGASGTLHFRASTADFFGYTNTYFIAGLTIEGISGGGSQADFTDLTFCVGSGLGDGGTGTGDGDGGGGPGTDPPPVDPPGGDPTPPAPGDRPHGTFNIPVGIFNVWNFVPKHFTVSATINLINQARLLGSKLCFFSYSENDWRDSTGVFRYTLWKAKWDLLIGNAAVKAAIDLAIADGIIVCHYVIDEPYNTNVLPYGGPVAFTDVERMCGDSKAAFPTLSTMVALAPRSAQQGWWMVRHMNNLDWLYHDYQRRASPDPIRYRDENIDRARALNHIFCPGIHYNHFDGVGSGYITPAALRFYGKIVTDPRTGEMENFAPFFMGWQFVQAMYDQVGFPAADRYVRDNFRANYP